MDPNDHDKTPLHKILYFVGGKVLTIDQKMVTVQRSLFMSTPLNLI
jgi:hypothetical protein